MKNLLISVLLSFITFTTANAEQPGSKQFGADFNKMKSLKDTLDFDYINGANLEVKKDAHMHHLTLKFKNKNMIEQHWTQFKDGKSAGTNIFALSRTN